MDLNDTPELASYRAKIRKWLEENKAAAPQLHDYSGDKNERVVALRAWQRKLAEGGLVGIAWPKEYGGQGLGPLELVVTGQELVRAEVPGPFDAIGVGMLGPTIIAHGSEEQKQRYLGSMLHADEVWCQLFSEPAAGSDLAAVQTRAEQLDDGGWRISGQKVWTTNGQYASFGLLLARTDPDLPKHKGLTMFVVPMDAEGIEVRPLKQISGAEDFNEVFFDGVRLPAGFEVGQVGSGWGVALTTLMFERVTISASLEQLGFSPDRFAEQIGSDRTARQDHQIRHRLGELAVDLLALRYGGFRILTQLSQGRIPGPEAALNKITAINSGIAAGNLLADVKGPEIFADRESHTWISYLPGMKSAGGTEQILRNTVGERVLGLPPEPRLDKGVPFSELKGLERERV